MLADPVLLQAVDPRVLQAVLVSAAAANLDFPNIPSTPPPQATTPVPFFSATRNIQQQCPPKFGQPFNNVPDQSQGSFLEQPRNNFAERPQENQNNFLQPNRPQFGSSFYFPQENPNEIQNKFRPKEQQQHGSAFKAVPSLLQQTANNFQQPKEPQKPEFRGNFNLHQQNSKNQLDSEVEFIVADFGGNTAEKVRFEKQHALQSVQVDLPNLPPEQKFGRQEASPDQGDQRSQTLLPLGFTNQELLKTLQENPDIA